jgi:hypothetical protein
MSPVPLQGVSDRDVLTHGVETPGSITPLLRSEELSLMRMPSAALRAAEGEKGEKEAFLSPRPEGRGYSSPHRLKIIFKQVLTALQYMSHYRQHSLSAH